MTGIIMAATALAIDAAMTNGVAFLLSKQAEDGHWSDPQVPALTAERAAFSCRWRIFRF